MCDDDHRLMAHYIDSPIITPLPTYNDSSLSILGFFYPYLAISIVVHTIIWNRSPAYCSY